MTDSLRPPSVDERPAQIGQPARYPGQPSPGQVRGDLRKRAERAGRIVPWLFVSLVAVALSIPVYFLFPVLRDSFRQNALRENGIEATGDLIDVRSTNTEINHQPLIELKVRVHPANAPPFDTEVSQPFSTLYLSDLRPGARVRLRYDPEQPSLIVITHTKVGSSPSTSQSSSEPMAPLADPQVHPICKRAHECCLRVTEGASSTNCQTLLGANLPQAACQTMFDALRRSAEAFGKSCD